MRRLFPILLTLALAAAVHGDWHLVRSAHHHHRLSLGWGQHWVFAALAFAAIGWVVARVWPERPWQPGAWIMAFALLLAQGVEPMTEVALYLNRFGYPDEPGRWMAFFVCLAVGLPAYSLALWLCRPVRRSGVGASPATAT